MRVPKQSPVTALHLRADHAPNGNPRRCFVVLDRRGYFVEAIDEGYLGSSALSNRYPWFHSSVARDLGITPAYPEAIDVPVSEYKRQFRRMPTDEACEAIKARADRFELSRA